jgi:hypothetical protein
MNAEDLLRQVREAPRFTVEVALLLDAAAFDEARRLNDRLFALPYEDDDVTAVAPIEVAERLHQLYQDTPETRFVLQARTAAEWDQLHGEAGDDDGEFVLHLFAACCVEPSGWTVDSARDLRASLTVGQWATLVAALRQLNEGLFDLRPTSAATALMRGMRRSLTTAPNEE